MDLTFGEKLKKLREEAGLTKQKITQLLNIPLKYLELLEQGEFEKMPGQVYIRGILKKYAKYLEVGEDILLADFDQETKAAKRSSDIGYQSLPSLKLRRFIVTPKLLGMVLGGLILVLVVSYLLYQLNFLVKPPKLIIYEPAGNIFIEQNLTVIKGQTEPGSKLTINGQQINIDKDGNFEQRIDLNQGLNSIKIQSTTRFEKSTSVTREILVR